MARRIIDVSCLVHRERSMFEFHASDLNRCTGNESLSTYELNGARSQGTRISCTAPDIPEAIVFLERSDRKRSQGKEVPGDSRDARDEERNGLPRRAVSAAIRYFIC